MSGPVDSLDFLFPYIAFNTARCNYKQAINAWKPVLDRLVASGAVDKTELLSMPTDWGVGPNPADVQNLVDHLHTDETNALDALNNFLNN